MKNAHSRRTLLKLAAAGSMATMPSMAAAMPARPIDELPIDRATRLAEELGEVMNEYLDGLFLPACIRRIILIGTSCSNGSLGAEKNSSTSACRN